MPGLIPPVYQSRWRTKLVTAEALQHTGLRRVLRMIARRPRQSLTILAYHRVVAIGDERAFDSDLELVSASPEQFDAQMAFIAREFTPITFATLLECIDAGRSPPDNAAIVTFDDGFGDNYLHAFPILKHHRVPATIFLSTGYLDRQEPYWFESLARMILTSNRPLALHDGLVLDTTLPLHRRRATVEQVLRYLKRIPDDARLKFIERLESEAGSGVAHTPVDRLPMTWPQVLEMAAAGIEFGSHTVDHPVLAQLDDAAVRRELRDSKLRIEQVLGKPAPILSYPVGGAEAFDQRIRGIALEAGYRMAVSYAPGGNTWPASDLFCLRRLRIERYVPSSLFKAMASFPAVFSV